MMIGPEPITRMRCRSVRRGMSGAKQIVDDVGVSQARCPTGRLLELRRRSDEHGNVGGTDQRWFGRNVSVYASLKQDSGRKLAHAESYAARDVVHFAGRAAF